MPGMNRYGCFLLILSFTLLAGQPVCTLIGATQQAKCGYEAASNGQSQWRSALAFRSVLAGIGVRPAPYGDEGTVPVTSEQILKLNIPRHGLSSHSFVLVQPLHGAMLLASSPQGEWTALASKKERNPYANAGPRGINSLDLEAVSVFRPSQDELMLRLTYLMRGSPDLQHTSVVMKITPNGDDSCSGLLHWMCSLMSREDCRGLFATTTTTPPKNKMSLTVQGTKTLKGKGKCAVPTGSEKLPEHATNHDTCALRCGMENTHLVQDTGGEQCRGFSWNRVSSQCILHMNGKVQQNSNASDTSNWECWGMSLGLSKFVEESKHGNETGSAKDNDQRHLKLTCNGDAALAIRHRVVPLAQNCFNPFYWFELQADQGTLQWATERRLSRPAIGGRIANAGQVVDLAIGTEHFNYLLANLPIVKQDASVVDTLVTSDRLCIDLSESNTCMQNALSEDMLHVFVKYFVVLGIGVCCGYCYLACR